MDKDGMQNNLVSDDDDFIFNSTLRPNAGITLPDIKNATHNIALSPLFFLHNGRSSDGSDNVIIYRNGNGYLYSATSHPDSESYRIQFDRSGTIWPTSSWIRNVGFSLRCLVSTKRQASE